MANDPRNGMTASTWMLSGSLVFTFMGFFTTLLADQVSWQIVALGRSGLAFSFSLVLALAAGARLVLHDSWFLWQRSLAGSVSLVCTFHALTCLPLAEVLMVTNTFPVWLAMLSWPLLGEKPGWRVWVSALMGVAGVALVKQPWDNDGWSLDWLPLLTSLVAAWSTAFAMIGLNHLKHLGSFYPLRPGGILLVASPLCGLAGPGRKCALVAALGGHHRHRRSDLPDQGLHRRQGGSGGGARAQPGAFWGAPGRCLDWPLVRWPGLGGVGVGDSQHRLGLAPPGPRKGYFECGKRLKND